MVLSQLFKSLWITRPLMFISEVPTQIPNDSDNENEQSRAHCSCASSRSLPLKYVTLVTLKLCLKYFYLITISGNSKTIEWEGIWARIEKSTILPLTHISSLPWEVVLVHRDLIKKQSLEDIWRSPWNNMSWTS